MEEPDVWLNDFVWEVHRAHAEFVSSNCFDSGSLFHSDARAHNPGNWEKPQYSVQIVEASGTPGAKAAAANARLPLRCKVFLWDEGDTKIVDVTNGDLITLLRTGDMAAFRAAAQAH